MSTTFDLYSTPKSFAALYGRLDLHNTYRLVVGLKAFSRFVGKSCRETCILCCKKKTISLFRVCPMKYLVYLGVFLNFKHFSPNLIIII